MESLLVRAKDLDGNLVTGYFRKIGLVDYETKELRIVSQILMDEVNVNNNGVEIDPETICKCTGLKDKTGKLIFEGDYLVEANKYEQIEYLVEWCKDNAGFKVVDVRTYWGAGYQGTADNTLVGLDFTDTKWIIISNKFDNPELLKADS